MTHEKIVQKACGRALKILKLSKLRFKPMKRKNLVNTKRGFVIGRISLKTGLVTIDIWTPKKQEPKKISSILRTLCHEAAHEQKKPYKQRFKGHWIIRQHYPRFYRQVKRNILALKRDKKLGKLFS